MWTRTILFCAFITILLFMAACGGGANNAPATNTAASNIANSTNPLETNKAATETVSNNAPTLTPVFKAYCEAWVKNDEAGLRKVYSTDTIKKFEEEMKEEKAKSLMKFLSTDKVSGTPCEARNEKITGDTATATIISNKYPNGIPVVFVKENGEWKMTNRSGAIDAVAKPGQPVAN